MGALGTCFGIARMPAPTITVVRPMAALFVDIFASGTGVSPSTSTS